MATENLSETVAVGFYNSMGIMIDEVKKHVEEKDIEGAVLIVVKMDDKNEVDALCGILSTTCPEEGSKDDFTHDLHHRLQLLEDAGKAIHQKAIETYTEIVRLKAASQASEGKGH